MLVKAYLQLFRIPGIFTAISNILFGFFVVSTSEVAWFTLPLLLASSASLYLAGMTLNDFFDYKTDKKERSFRPLSAGKISRNRALVLGVLFIVSANVWSTLVGQQSLFLSITMSALILLYNAQAKKIIPLGILILCIIRFLNVLLGASSEPMSYQFLLLPIPLAILIAGVGALSSVETKSATKPIMLFNLATLAAIIVSMIMIFYDKLGADFAVFSALFVISTVLPTVILKGKTSVSIQKIITFQLLSIIVLDATMTVIFTEFLYGLVILSLYLPSFLIGKKIYVT